MVAWVLTLGMTAGVLTADASRRAIPLDGYSAVPLKTSGRYWMTYWVECEVGGRPVKLIVDTGAAYTVIVPELATLLGLKLGKSWRLSWAGGIKSEARPSAVRVKVGTADRDAFPVQVIDLSDVFAGSQGVDGIEFAGLLGADFLDEHNAILDFRGRRLLLRDVQAEDAAALQGEWRATGLTHRGVVRDGHWSVKKSRFVVTGTRFSLDTGTARFAGAITLLPGDQPRRLVVPNLTDGGQAVPGSHTFFYEIRGDTLRLLMGPTNGAMAAWPTGLESTSENKCTLWTFERIKRPEAPPPRPKGKAVASEFRIPAAAPRGGAGFFRCILPAAR
jgi:uncharacterized protein (TIGR03067 family)